MVEVKEVNTRVRKVVNGRLEYYQQAANPEYWDEHWKSILKTGFYNDAKQGDLGTFEKCFTTYLPRKEPILEAGCGLSQLVIALRKRGYTIEGVDLAKETIERVKSIFPDLPVKVGNVCALDVVDGYYGGYISLGVVEHRREGPEPFLAEAFRVLKPGGIAIFSVPFFNLIRRIKGQVGCFSQSETKGMAFYQYAYSSSEMEKYLRAVGFKIIDGEGSNSKQGFEDELPFLNRLYRKGTLGRGVKRIVRTNHLIQRFCGHSRRYICKKPI